MRRHLKMPIPQFFIKAKMYFNGALPSVEFRLSDDTISLVALTSKLNELLSDTDNKMVRQIEFREHWIDTNVRMKHNLTELKTDEDVAVMWRSFLCRLTKGPIELDANILRYVDDIIKIMKPP